MKVSSDQVLQAMFHVGLDVTPEHALALLLWFGAIKIDGRVPRTREDAPLLAQLFALATPDERRARTELNLADPDHDASEAMHDALRALHAAWLLGVPLGVDS